jgi:CHAT domain-containing protein
MAVSVLPSAGSLDDLRTVASRAAAPQPFLGVGDPKLQDGPPSSVAAAAVACRDPFLSDTSVLRGLPNLPETADELRTIAHTLHASADDLLLGAQATKPNVSHLPLDRYRVIEFATHALLPREIPCQNEPAIVLTPPLQGSAADDGLLSSGDIAALRLNAEWVILSACNTAGPDGSLRGEALSGLTRAFLYAGARSVLASLWTVASVPTVRLTTETLAQLQAHAGMTRAEALRQTELGMIATPKLSHPAFWAPFVLVSDGGRTAI